MAKYKLVLGDQLRTVLHGWVLDLYIAIKTTEGHLGSIDQNYV